MTSQDRPLTRRELRERERLLEQQAASATPQADAPAPAFPVSPPPQAAPAFPAQPPAAPAPASPAPAADAAPDASSAPAFAPRSAGAASAAGSPFAGPVAAPAPQSEDTPEPPDPSPFAPRATPQPWSRQAAATDDDDEPTPERTLTRRELRALIEATQLDEYDDELDDDPDDVARPAGAAQAAPSRTTTPHDARSGEQEFDPGVAAKPVGHWTSQLDLPEEQPEPFDQLLARAGGGSHGVPTTTSALILPSMPNQGAIAQPLPDGGEIIVTGSIDLPRSFGATGLHPGQLDSSDVDRLIDHVEDAGGGGAAPVSASRAISTQGHPRDMIAPPKKEGVNAPLVLAVTAGVLALGVVASLVVGAMVGLF
jgi:hypothetical protein